MKNLITFFIAILLLLSNLQSETLVVDDFNDGADPMLINSDSSIADILDVTHSYQPHSSTNSALGNTGYCLKISHTNTAAAWLVFDFNTNIHITNYRALSFWIRGENGGETFGMDLRGTNNEEPLFRPNINNFLTNGITTNWQKVVIPTYALRKEMSKTNIDALIFDFNGYPIETIYIDDITFHDKLAPCYVNNFDDGSDPNAWGINQWDWIYGNPSGAKYTYTYDPVNKVGNYGYGFKIVWTNGSAVWSNSSVTGCEMLPRDWGAGVSGEDLSICDRISFYARAGTNANGRRICLALYADPGSEQEIVNTNNVITLTSSWQQIIRNIPSDFPEITQQNICGVQWWIIRPGICTNTNDFTFYIDRVVFEDTIVPNPPTSLYCNGNPVSNGFNFNTITNSLSANADSGADDRSLECVYFEYSTNGTIWYRIGTDYDTSDSTYSSLWNITGLNDGATYSIKVVAMDTSGNKAELVYNNCSIGKITVTKNTDYNSFVSAGSNNVPVMAITVTDLLGDDITDIKISNSGDMSNSIDVEQVVLHYDANKNNLYDISDVTIATAVWNAANNSWDFTNLSVSSGSNLLVTIDISSNAFILRTFIARIDAGDVKCAGGVLNSEPITNSGAVTVKGHQIILIKTDINPSPYKVKASYTNMPVLAFTYIDGEEHSMAKFKLSHIGTMTNGIDVGMVKLWDEAGSIKGEYNGTENLLATLEWDGISKWTNNGLNIPNNTDILVTIDTLPTLTDGRTFQALIAETNDVVCINGLATSVLITNSGVLTADVTPPSPIPYFEAVASTNQIILQWTNSSSPDFKYTMIRYTTNTYPTNINDGILLCQKTNTPGSYDSYTHSSLTPGITYYYTAWAFDDVGNNSTEVTNSAIPILADSPSEITNYTTKNQYSPLEDSNKD